MHHAEVCKGAEKKRIYTLYTRCIEHYDLWSWAWLKCRL